MANILPSVRYTVEENNDSPDLPADIAERLKAKETARLLACKDLRQALIDSGAIVPRSLPSRGELTPFKPSGLPCLRLDENGRRLAAQHVAHELALIANPSLRWAEQRAQAAEYHKHRDPLAEFIDRRKQAA